MPETMDLLAIERNEPEWAAAWVSIDNEPCSVEVPYDKRLTVNEFYHAVSALFMDIDRPPRDLVSGP